MGDTKMNKNKTLVISGATRGIGRQIALRFAKEGINVAFTYNTNEQIAKDFIKELESDFKIKARAYQLNILEPNEYKEVFQKIDEDFDRVDYFVSNAIISGRSVVGGFSSFMRLKPKGLNNIYTATVLAFIVGAQEAAKRMQKNGGGSILSLSSTGNLVFTPMYTGHANSKNAVETVVKYGAAELGEMGIRVNAISGGPIDTDALKKFPNYEEVKKEVCKRSPLSRMGEAKDLAGMAYFVCSDECSWLTGQTIVIDGGTSFQ
jgi:7-alpha-hydroxysteroid dehydrogenase